MIRINLLPHREAKRVADLRETVAVLGLGLVLVGGGIYWAHTDVTRSIADAEMSVRQLEANIEEFKPQERQVGAFKERKKQLTQKIDVIEGLDRARSGPLRLLDELSTRVPDRLWLTKLKTNGADLTLEGESLDTGVVADFLRSLNESIYFANVDLDKTSRGKEIQGVKVVKFAIRAQMVNPSDRQSANADDKA